ncbi:monovalent cation/H(+) antiporter subunit G [Aquibacillus koreensis]|uniref:monovalent cation/H(+) antiporter subunit G n=1 Tax=Aquibacillus koreensis TaxID=279446 RepID=UPI0028833BBC|nr:monovalent cation/H(+) antiporter subunit G [Aquibacillus koreensis]
MIEIIISIFILLGGFFMLLGAFAINRLPDTFTRINAATKGATLGVIGVMIGVFLFFLYVDDIVSGKVLLTIGFVFLTSPASGFIMARAAYHVGVPLWEKSTHNDLKIDLEKKKQEG